jgi:hypothetical protein
MPVESTTRSSAASRGAEAGTGADGAANGDEQMVSAVVVMARR